MPIPSDIPSSSPGIALTFQNVSKSYRLGEQTITALNNVSFTIPAGSIQAVIGESGAGKSTLFRTASTLEAPASIPGQL